jgi:hypothetical protein
VGELREIASENDFVLLSPYPGLPAPVVASARGKQLKLDSAEDPGLERFVSAYQQGAQTPEPGVRVLFARKHPLRRSSATTCRDARDAARAERGSEAS